MLAKAKAMELVVWLVDVLVPALVSSSVSELASALVVSMVPMWGSGKEKCWVRM